MVIDPRSGFFLYGDAFVTEKILDFPGSFRKFDGLPAETKKKPSLEIRPCSAGNVYQGQHLRSADTIVVALITMVCSDPAYCNALLFYCKLKFQASRRAATECPPRTRRSGVWGFEAQALAPLGRPGRPLAVAPWPPDRVTVIYASGFPPFRI